MSPVGRVFLFTILFVLGAALKANASVSPSDTISILPSPEALLKSINNEGASREALLRNSLALFCGGDSPSSKVASWPGCSISSDIEAYKALAKKIFSGPNSEIMLHRQGELSPWDLRNIISLDFTVVPAASSAGVGVEALAELIYRRSLILKKLDLIQSRLRRTSADLPRLLLVPAIKAHILSASSMGHAISLVKSIQCEKGDGFCQTVRLHISRPMQSAVLKNQSQILELGQRLEMFGQTYQTSQAQQLQGLLDFARSVQDPSVQLTQAGLVDRLQSLVSSGLNSFHHDNFQTLARLMVVLAEAQILVDAIPVATSPSGSPVGTQGSPFSNQLSQLIQELHGAITVYGIELETEEL